MMSKEFLPKSSTDLPFEAENGSIHSAQNALLENFACNLFRKSIVSSGNLIEKSQRIHDLELLEGSVCFT